MKARRRGGPILLERHRSAPTVEHVAPGVALDDGEQVVAADGERGGGGWLYSAHRGKVLGVSYAWAAQGQPCPAAGVRVAFHSQIRL